MYYLFIRNEKELSEYKQELLRVKASMDAGKTPVYSELRSAKTGLIETVPYELICGCFLLAGTLFLDKIKLSSTISVAVVLIINSLCASVGNYVFAMIKHRLRINLCKRLGLEASEENIAAMESLEYQSV